MAVRARDLEAEHLMAQVEDRIRELEYAMNALKLHIWDVQQSARAAAERSSSDPSGPSTPGATGADRWVKPRTRGSPSPSP